MQNPGKQTARLLVIGFGGLLLLLAFSGFNALSVLRRIQTSNEAIRAGYLHRERILQQLREDIYTSGTYMRDFLLEPNPQRAETHRHDFETTHARIDRNIAAYSALVRTRESAAFQQFRTELASYFDSLQPALAWTPEQRKQLGYDFMNRSLLPRRTEIVRLANQVAAVNEGQMQTGSEEIRNLFTGFRRSLLAAVVITLLCGILLATLSVHRILRLEQTSARRFEEAEHARQGLRDLSARLIEVQESERRSLSRELHDEVGQSLSALLLGLGNLAAMVATDMAPRARAQIHQLRRLAEKTMASVRDMSLLLRPSMLDDLGLIPALQWQAREVSRNHDVLVEVNADSVPEDLPDDHKTCIYRIVQEALRNAVRHANASIVRIALYVRNDRLILELQDNGRGFSPDREKGLGLLGMQERVAHLNGAFTIESRPGEGASLRVELPVAAPTRIAIEA